MAGKEGNTKPCFVRYLSVSHAQSVNLFFLHYSNDQKILLAIGIAKKIPGLIPKVQFSCRHYAQEVEQRHAYAHHTYKRC